jgi:hypothetical protein
MAYHRRRRRPGEEDGKVRSRDAALLVVLSLALSGAGADATTMILEPAGEYTMASSGAVTYSGEGVEITCAETLEDSAAAYFPRR